MKGRICEMLDVDSYLVAFSHCGDVVAAVSLGGDFALLDVAFSPDHFDLERDDVAMRQSSALTPE